MNRRKLVLMSLITLLFSGCNIYKQQPLSNLSKNNYHNFSDAKDNKNNISSHKSDSQKLIGQTKLDLRMLIDIACENNPTVKRSWHLARSMEARYGQTKSAFYPTVVVSGRIDRSELNTPLGKDARQKSLSNSYYPSVEMHYSLFKFGGTRQSAEAAKNALYAANFQFDRTLQSIVHDVENSYFMLSSAEQTVIAKQNDLEDAKGAYESAFIRHQSGLINIQEYLQAKANKAQAEFELECALANVESNRANLAQLIGVRVSKDIEILHPIVRNNLKETDQSIDDLMAEVIKNRPDIKAAYFQVLSKKKLTKSIQTNMLPELIIGGSGNKKEYEHIKGSFDNFSVFAGLEWKIFDGFKNIYDIIESKENVRIAVQELRQTELQAQSEVWTYYFSFKSALKQLDTAKRFLASAEESFQSMKISYDSGLCKFTDLLTAQSCLANARQQLISSENNLLTNLSNLAYSTGGIVSIDSIK